MVMVLFSGYTTCCHCRTQTYTQTFGEKCMKSSNEKPIDAHLIEIEIHGTPVGT